MEMMSAFTTSRRNYLNPLHSFLYSSNCYNIQKMASLASGPLPMKNNLKNFHEEAIIISAQHELQMEQTLEFCLFLCSDSLSTPNRNEVSKIIEKHLENYDALYRTVTSASAIIFHFPFDEHIYTWRS